jgi:hypothetical protein
LFAEKSARTKHEEAQQSARIIMLWPCLQVGQVIDFERLMGHTKGIYFFSFHSEGPGNFYLFLCFLAEFMVQGQMKVISLIFLLILTYQF